MRRTLLLALCTLVAACAAPLGEEDKGFKDIVPTDHAEEMDIQALPGSHGCDPWSVLPTNPIDWKTCACVEGDHPCNIEAIDHNGDSFSLYSLFGRPIVLDFSAGWCGPCRAAAEHAQEVQNQYSDTGLLYITVLIETAEGNVPTPQDVQAWAQEYGNTSSLVIGGSRAMLESAGGTWALSGWPTFYYIDRNMVLRDIDRGYSAEEVIYSIEWLLTQ
jgi:thiol-disulfide isomerase/thioredoxin